MVRPTRVRRLRARRLRDATIVAVAASVVSFALVQAQAKDVHDVGVWVVERSGATPFGKAAGALEEAVASAVGIGAAAVPVRVVVSGKVHDVATNAGTVEELLSAMGIDPDADDRVAPSPSTPLHPALRVRVDRVDVRVLSTRAVLRHRVVTTYTTSLGIGRVQVVREGRDGLVERTVRQVIVNGLVETSVSGTEVLRRPVAELRRSGPLSPTGGSLTEPGTGARSQRGQATWYDPPWSGLTAAHPWLPKGTMVTVTDVASGRSVTVVIDDRGPFSPGRVIDLSPEAFAALAPLGRGVLQVRLTW
jgi:rare lipoprotein A